MILFLPFENYLAQKPDYFNLGLLKLLHSNIINNVKKIYWFPETHYAGEISFDRAGIKNIVVTDDGVNDNDIINELVSTEVHYFSDNLNNRMIALLKRINNKKGFYRKFSERKIRLVEDHSLLFSVFDEISKFKIDNTFEKQINEINPPGIGETFIEKLCSDAIKKLFAGKKYFFVNHNEQVLYNKLITYLENITKSKAHFENALSNLKYTHSSKLTKKIKILVYSDSYRITQSIKSRLLSEIEEIYPNLKWIIFNESTNDIDDEFIPDYCEIVKMPNYKQIKDHYNLTEIFYLILSELARVNNCSITYETNESVNDELIRAFISGFESLTDLYNTLKEIHPSGNFTIHSWHPDYWYNLLSAKRKIAEIKSASEKTIEINLMPSMSTEERSEPESAETKNKINPVIQGEGSTNIYPNRIEKVGKKIKIYFSGNYIELEDETLDGLNYIYLLVKSSTESSPLYANELYEILKPQKKQRSSTDSYETQNINPQQKRHNNDDWNEEEEIIPDDEDKDISKEDDETELDQEPYATTHNQLDRKSYYSHFTIRELRLKIYSTKKAAKSLIEKIGNLDNLLREERGGAKAKQLTKERKQALEKYDNLSDQIIKFELELKSRPSDRSTYQTVKSSIDRAIEAIEEADKTVGRIFNESINRSQTFYYHPSDNPTELFKAI